MIKYRHRHHQEYLLHGVSLLASGADQRPSLQILATSTKGKPLMIVCSWLACSGVCSNMCSLPHDDGPGVDDGCNGVFNLMVTVMLLTNQFR